METIDVVLNEMREAMTRVGHFSSKSVADWADRIDAAYRRNRQYQESKCAANEELARKLTKQREINKELVDENARLRRDLAEAVHESCSNCYHNKPDDPWCDGCAVASWKETLERKEAENEDR